MESIEYNDSYEINFFTITSTVTVYDRMFKFGQQFKWRYKKRQKVGCCSSERYEWIYYVDAQTNECELSRVYPISEEFGSEDHVRRPWFELSPSEQLRNVGRDVFHQPHRKEHSLGWTDKDGYMKNDV